jgi:carboxyl-terminal processing protease
MPRFLCATILVVTLVSAVGCSILDPNRIVTRTNLPSPVATTPVPMPNENWRQAAIDFVWTTVNERYYDPKLNGVDWRAARAQYEPLMLAAKSDDEFWELLDKMTGVLKDSHTRVHSPKQVQQDRANESHSLGLGMLVLNDNLVLTSVHPQSDAFWAGVRAGMLIKTIDGKPAVAHYNELVAAARENSTPWARVRGAARKINGGDIGTVSVMTFVRVDGSEITVSMKRRRFAASPDFTPRVLPSGFGYIRFSNFVGRLQDDIIAEIARMKDTPGIIVDLRNNGGGAGAMSRNLLAQFFKDTQTGFKTITRSGKPLTVAFVPITKMDEVIKGVGAAAYTKPVVVLTNANSASASEIFAGAMRETKRATLVGQRTCGCLLGYFGLADVPGGAQMAYSEIGFITKSGLRIEGEGVPVDIEVIPTREDYLLSRDRALERAVAHLQAVTQAAASAEPAVGVGGTR